jgi:hypothetical protein
MSTDQIAIAETYRGVPIHANQPRERIATIVKPAIDVVCGMTDAEALAAYAADPANPPEARLLAAARCEASFAIAAEERRSRPAVDLDRLHAAVAGLDSVTWRDPDWYCSLLDDACTAARRDPPLPD